MRFSIRAKILMTVSLSLVLIFALIMYLLVSQNISRLRTNLNEQSKSFAALATSPIGNTFLLYHDSGSIRITQEVDHFLELDPDVTAIRVVSVDGNQLYASQDKRNQPIGAHLASSFQPQYLKSGNDYVYEIIQPFFEDSGAHRYAVVYEVSIKRVEQNVKDEMRLIIYVGAAILAMSIIVTGLLLDRLFIKPLRAVSRSANLISSGNFDQQIKSKNQDEIGDLAQSVNKMADFLKADIVKLRELDKLKTEFMMIASHNLRTPITIIRGYIEVGDKVETVHELKAIIKTVQESVVRLHLLAEDLLTISTLEADAEPMKKEATLATDYINSLVNEFGLLATKKDLHWEFTNTIPGDVRLLLSQPNMRSALGNVIDNAIKFTKPGGSVQVTGDISDNRLVFTVADTGIGIQPDEIAKLFTKFHRGTSTTNYDYEGVGIGLYLTKLIIEQHSGHIDVKSKAGAGSTFTVYLPLTSPVAANSVNPDRPS